MDEQAEDYLLREPIENAIALYDLKFKKEKNEFFICRKEGAKTVQAYLLNFHYSLGSISYLRGNSREAISKLLDFLPKGEKNTEINTDPVYLPLLKGAVKPSGIKIEYLMVVRKGEERLIVSPNSTISSPDYAHHCARLLFEEQEINGELVRESEEAMKKGLVYDVVIDGKLVSVATASAKLPFVWVVASVYTASGYRRRGYGTLVTSAVTEDALRHADAASLYVEENNYDAIRIYERLGYNKRGKSAMVYIGSL